ncbi:MAG: putative rane protein [Naasia sp.]|nr:putative rane protein [Naasia sp.]
MVSLLTPTTEPAPQAPLDRASPSALEVASPPAATGPVRPVTGPTARRRHRLTRGGFDPYPFDPVLRNLLRLLFAAPLAVVAVVANGTASVELTGNWALMGDLARYPFGSTRIEDTAAFYPPVSSLAGALLPGGSLGLGIAGALVAGVFLQKLLEIMVQREMSGWLIGAYLTAVAANPLFAFLAVGNLPALVGIAFFGVGLSHMRRFITWGSTRDGFVAGLLFMLAALSDSGAILYVVTAAAAAPFLSWRRGEQRGARGASVFVLLFPTLSAFVSLVGLEVLFRVDPVGPLMPLLTGTPARFTELVTGILPDMTGALLAAPVAAAWVISLIVKRPGGMLASTLVFLAILGGSCVGLVPSSSAGSTFVLMVLLAITLLSRPERGRPTAAVIAIVLAHVPIAWATALDREIVAEWLAAVVEAALLHLG